MTHKWEKAVFFCLKNWMKKYLNSCWNDSEKLTFKMRAQQREKESWTRSELQSAKINKRLNTKRFLKLDSIRCSICASFFYLQETFFPSFSLSWVLSIFIFLLLIDIVFFSFFNQKSYNWHFWLCRWGLFEFYRFNFE